MRTLIFLALMLPSCATIEDGNRVRAIRGPANMHISPVVTPWGSSPGLSMELKDDGWVWFGPSGSVVPRELPMDIGEFVESPAP
jgi:hypothetical protein